MLGLALLVIAGAGVYTGLAYRVRLGQAVSQVQPLARLEAQATAQNDAATFLALQDPDDPAWRQMQAQRFGRLERAGLPELGWQAAGLPAQTGGVALEPGGVRIDVTYYLSVTHPLPGGPSSIAIRVPQFYRSTSLGWVHARPSPEFWGQWRTLQGAHVTVAYTARDAGLVDGLVARLDPLLQDVCARLSSCPYQPLYLVLDTSPESVTHLAETWSGLDNDGITIHFPSPHLLGEPADAASRSEMERAIAKRIVQALVFEASHRQMNSDYVSAQAILAWEWAHFNLEPPPVDIQSLSQIWPVASETRLGAIWLRPRVTRTGALPVELVMPLALTFLQDKLGDAAVESLLPALATTPTLGDALQAGLDIQAGTLESAWQSYVQSQIRPDPLAQASAPQGELALWCWAGSTRAAIWQERVDGTGSIPLLADTEQTWWPGEWSPQGAHLATVEHDRLLVLAPGTGITRTLPYAGLVSWLSDVRLKVSSPIARGADLIDLATGQDQWQPGSWITWSPDDQLLAYSTVEQLAPTVWVQDKRGSRRVASGYSPAWSPQPGTRQLAFLAQVQPNTPPMRTATLEASELQILDLDTGNTRTLARKSDLVPSGNRLVEWTLQEISWSPDGKLLAIVVAHLNQSALVAVVDAGSGAVRVRWAGTDLWFPLSGIASRAWSPDSRYLALWAMPDSPVTSLPGFIRLLDMQTGQVSTIPAAGWWDWSPDGKWLAIPQPHNGLLVVAPDLQTGYRRNLGRNCYNIAWRPTNP